MKKKTFILLILVILVAPASFFWQYHWVVPKDVIYLKTGSPIIADKTWTGGKIVYYESNGSTLLIPKKNVAQIVKGEYLDQRNGKTLIMGWSKKALTKIKKFAPLPDHSSQGKNILAWIAGCLPWVLLIFIIAIVIKRLSFKKKQSLKEENIDKHETNVEKFVPATRSPVDDMEKIVLFFLNLFKIKLKAPEESPGQFSAVGKGGTSGSKIFELRVMQKGKWTSRRMTIGPLGQGTGSKSKCFYVIYDVHIVIKIPPTALKNFKHYMANINKEGEIVKRLSPLESIIPRVSTIMKRVRQFHDENDLSIERLEDRYIRWLTNKPDAQNFLKINGKFVFFMDLSKHFFLGHILDNLHSAEERLESEILSNPRIIWDQEGFSGRYGEAAGAVFPLIQDLYENIESVIMTLKDTLEEKPFIQAYQVKDLFITILAGKSIDNKLEKIPLPKKESLVNSIQQILDKNDNVLRAHRSIVMKHIRSMTFNQNKAQVSSILTNLLELLATLGMKKVAMRDLKPDNLLVAGETSKYPLFLNSAKDFSIGLIDVETAVYYGIENNRQIPQPQLGGTPFYATPSHLFINKWIEEIFGDIPRILFLQDWYATVAMIYKAVTGEVLFKKTGRLLPSIKLNIQKQTAEGKKISSIIPIVSAMFWKNAEKEFQGKIHENREKLISIETAIGPKARGMLKQEAGNLLEKINSDIKEMVNHQEFFPDKKNKQQLAMASYRQIMNLKLKWDQAGGDSSSPADSSQKVVLLNNLGLLKSRAEEIANLIPVFDQEAPLINAHDLMVFLFYNTKFSMLKRNW